jgi:hypothetical protein
MSQCIDIKCSMSQYIDIKCSMSQRIDIKCSMSQCIDIKCIMSQCIDIKCSMSQYIDIKCSMSQCIDIKIYSLISLLIIYIPTSPHVISHTEPSYWILTYTVWYTVYPITLDNIIYVSLCTKDIAASGMVFITYSVFICITDSGYRYIEIKGRNMWHVWCQMW